MRVRTAALLTALVLPLTAACSSGASETGDTATPSATPAAASKTPSNTPSATTAASAELPDLVGKGLQSAQDTAQAAGFYGLTSHDALGRARNQILDRNWKVCFQTPAAGKQPTDTTVDLGAVKLEEDCPAKDAGAASPSDDAGSMPDFTGKSAKAARQALPSNASLTVNDVSGDDRMVLVESNWQVCSQEPAAGAKLDGQPVTLNVVKFEESCP